MKRSDQSKAELRRQAEQQLNERSQDSSSAPLTDLEMQRLLHELQVHQIELELQNEELLQARTEAETALQQYAELYDFAPVGYLTLGRDGTIHRVNLNGARLLGVERSGLIQRRLGLFVAESFRPIFNDFLVRVFSNPKKETCELALEKEIAPPTWVQLEAISQDGLEGRAILLDISERKQAEDRLRYQAALLENVNDAIVASDADYRLTFWNAAAEKLYGWQAEEVLGQEGIGILVTEWLGVAGEEMRQAIAELGRWRGEATQLRRDGSRLPVEISSLVLRDEREQITGYVSICRDITQRMRAEQELKAYSDQLEEMVAERTRQLLDAREKLARHEKLVLMGQLAGGVGHELRNPLAVIKNATYYLKLVLPDASGKVRQYLGLLEQETANAEKIIADLLDYARIESMEQEPARVAELVQRALERFPAPSSVEVSLDLPQELPEVFADPRQVVQVLGNLLLNAWQAMASTGSATGVASTGSATGVAKGGVLSVSGDTVQAPGGQPSGGSERWVRIMVKDTGVGIPPENIEKIFEPLFTTKSQGIGLGLVVSRKLAEANGGRIEVQSQPGKGSTFTLWLPAVHSDAGI